MGPYIHDIQEKCLIFAPPPPSLLFLSVQMGSNWARPPTPGRRNLGYQTPSTHIPFTILAKNCNAKKKTKMLSQA